jgi:hypothetical protein
MPNLSLATQHAGKYWAEVCEDGTVMTKEKRIVIKDQYKEFNITDPTAWKPVFLKYDSGGRDSEGLFFVPSNDSRTSLNVRNANRFRETAFDNPVDHSPGGNLSVLGGTREKIISVLGKCLFTQG